MLKCVICFVLGILSGSAWADDDIRTIKQICLKVMRDSLNIQRVNAIKLCNCSSSQVEKAITEYQRLSLRVTKNYLSSGEKPPPDKDLILQSGLKSLIQASQDYCENELWPSNALLSTDEHQKYSTLATKSSNEFIAFSNDICRTTPIKTPERARCMVYASKEWLSSKGGNYLGIDSRYITGNDLAWQTINGK